MTILYYLYYTLFAFDVGKAMGEGFLFGYKDVCFRNGS
jgi:hypothetical protein